MKVKDKVPRRARKKVAHVVRLSPTLQGVQEKQKNNWGKSVQKKRCIGIVFIAWKKLAHNIYDDAGVKE